MIVVRAPLRVSFFGGGSDMPEFYENEKQPGCTLSVAIDKYMYLVVNKTPKNYIKAVYDRIESVEDLNELQHDRIRETLKKYTISRGIEVASFCEMPTKGTGLGSSSTFTVALCRALGAMNGWSETEFEVAESAYDIERNMCGDILGKQDQYAAAFGGMNEYIFNSDGSVSVSPIIISTERSQRLRDNLMLFYTGTTRVANDILSKQGNTLVNDKKKRNGLKSMVDFAHHARDILESETADLDEFGKMLDVSWQFKKTLANNISNPEIDKMYSAALKAGAIGGKILGAGGGGFLLLYVPPKKRHVVQAAMSSYEEFSNFDFTERGAEVVYDDGTTRF